MCVVLLDSACLRRVIWPKIAKTCSVFLFPLLFRKEFIRICKKEVRVPGAMIMKNEALRSQYGQTESVVNKVQDFQENEELFRYCTLPQVKNKTKLKQIKIERLWKSIYEIIWILMPT